ETASALASTSEAKINAIYIFFIIFFWFVKGFPLGYYKLSAQSQQNAKRINAPPVKSWDHHVPPQPEDPIFRKLSDPCQSVRSVQPAFHSVSSLRTSVLLCVSAVIAPFTKAAADLLHPGTCSPVRMKAVRPARPAPARQADGFATELLLAGEVCPRRRI